MKKSTNTGNQLYSGVLILLIVGTWQLSVSSGKINNFVLPYPRDVITTLWKIKGDLLVHLQATMKEALLGLLIAVIISIILAFLMDSVEAIKKAIFPILLVTQTVPVILFAPLFSMWFGFGMTPKIIVVAIVCFFPIVVSLIEGLNSVDNDQIHMLESMGAGPLQIFQMVKFPSAMITFFSGLKVAATYSFMGAVISEWMGGNEGLGIYFLRAKKSFDINRVFAVVLVIVVLSMLIYYLVAKLQVLSTPWQMKAKASIKK